MATITKKDLIDRVATATGQKRGIVKETLQTFLDQIITELGAGNRLEFRDFGVFEIKKRAPRTAQNPKTLERVEVPAKRTVKFKVGRLMKQSLEATPPTSNTSAADTPAKASKANGKRSSKAKTNGAPAKPTVKVRTRSAGALNGAAAASRN